LFLFFYLKKGRFKKINHVQANKKDTVLAICAAVAFFALGVPFLPLLNSGSL
jgi:hypothetical protein